MNTTTIVLIVSAMLILTPVMRVFLQPQIQRTSPRKRYTVFAILLGCGVSGEILAAVVSLIEKKPLAASLSLVTALLFCLACILEMRKLGREF